MNGKRHRDGARPALDYPGGIRAWYVHGKLHRDSDLPSIECPGVFNSWWMHGKQHRGSDLPALIYATGTKEWWIYGINYTEKRQSIQKISAWCRRMFQRRFVLLIWRVMTPIHLRLEEEGQSLH